MERLLLRPAEAAEMLGLGKSTVYQLISSGDLPAVYIGRSVRVPLRELEKMVDQQLQERGHSDQVVVPLNRNRSNRSA